MDNLRFAEETGMTSEVIEGLIATIARLQDKVIKLEAELEARERRFVALQKNLERAAQSLLSASKAEKRERGKLPS